MVKQWKEYVNSNTGHLSSSQRGEESEVSIGKLWNTIKQNNICITGVPGEGEIEIKSVRKFEEIMSDFPSLGRDVNTQFMMLIGPCTDSFQRGYYQDTL